MLLDKWEVLCYYTHNAHPLFFLCLYSDPKNLTVGRYSPVAAVVATAVIPLSSS